LPGGHVDYGEDPEVAVMRELQEECSLSGAGTPELLEVRGKPDRDPRYHIVTIVYRVRLANTAAEPVHGDDASSAKFIELSELIKLPPNRFYGDHWIII
jgi:8-oxo-dGTP diphosphatase